MPFCVTRLVPQKGIHLIRAAVLHTVASGGQFVLLGSGHAEGDFRGLAEGELQGSTAAKCAPLLFLPRLRSNSFQ
jgi:glycogen synthase